MVVEVISLPSPRIVTGKRRDQPWFVRQPDFARPECEYDRPGPIESDRQPKLVPKICDSDNISFRRITKTS